MKYAHYKKTNGKLLGWYDSEVHGIYVPEIPEVLNADGTVKTPAVPSYYDVSGLPTPNIEVSEADWQVAIDNNYNYVDATTNTLSYKDFRTLAELKTSKTNEINSACSKAITSGFTSSALGTPHTYQSEQTDQLNLIGVVTAGTDDYFKCGVTDANGNITWNYELHTIVQLQQVLADGKAHKQALLQKANTLKVQVASATTVAKVKAIVW